MYDGVLRVSVAKFVPADISVNRDSQLGAWIYVPSGLVALKETVSREKYISWLLGNHQSAQIT